jgi:Fe-S oxidoreductase
MEDELLHPARAKILGIPGQIFLLLIIGAGVGIFLYKAYEAYRLIMKGQKENRFDSLGERIKSVILYALAQLRIFADPLAGFMHIFIFWGFVTLSVGYGNAIISAFWKGFAFPLTRTEAYLILHDVIAAMVILSVLIALFRRLVIRPPRLEYTAEAIVILCLIFSIVSLDFASEGFKRAYELSVPASGGYASMGYAPPVTAFIGEHLRHANFATSDLIALSAIAWWLHMMLIFSFLAYLPFSKHFHIVTAAINVFLRNLKPVGQLSKLDIENSETFGVTTMPEFTWKSLFDLFVCTECGRCSDNCPAHQTEKPLSPKKVIQDLKKHLKGSASTLLANAPPKEGEAQEAALEPIVDKALKPDELWSCTTCGACQQACPVFIEHIPKIIDVRRSQVLNESQFPQEVVLTFKNMENNFNPYGMGFQSRGEWAKDMGIKVLGEGGTSDTLFWVGCVGSYDERNKKVSQAVASLLKSAGVDFAILASEEACCGDPARRIGNEYLYQTLVDANIEHFKNYGIKKIITHCPHCFNTLKNEYGQFGAEFEVIHTTTLINDLVKEGRLKPLETHRAHVTYHDSCYLGRYNNIYDPPRELLGQIPGVQFTEIRERREQSFCCGAGGGRMWMEENLGTRINKRRIEQAMKTDPTVIASNCPYCLTMLTDGIKDMNLEEKVKVLDLMELVERACTSRKEPAKTAEAAEVGAS